MFDWGLVAIVGAGVVVVVAVAVVAGAVAEYLSNRKKSTSQNNSTEGKNEP